MANWAGSAIDGLLCYCRAGFEPELAGELTERAAQAGFAGYARTERNTGHVLFVCDDADALSRSLPWSTLIFARQKLRLFADLAALDPRDRIAPMLAALPADIRYGELVMEHPDSDSGKPMAGLARSLGNALRPALRKADVLTREDNPRLQRLHVCLLDGDHALLASSEPEDSAPWPLGIPRLRMHADAPSRSALHRGHDRGPAHHRHRAEPFAGRRVDAVHRGERGEDGRGEGRHGRRTLPRHPRPPASPTSPGNARDHRIGVLCGCGPDRANCAPEAPDPATLWAPRGRAGSGHRGP